MSRIPELEISTIKRTLAKEGIICKKEREMPSYGLHRYACDFDTKGEQKSSIGIEWFRLKLINNPQPHFEPTKDYDYAFMESVLVIPRSKDGFCPKPISLEKDNKIIMIQERRRHTYDKIDNRKHRRYRFCEY